MWGCGPLNETGPGQEPLCHDLRLGLAVLSLLYLAVGVPVGLAANALLVLVNLCHKSAMTMPDVYFVNMAVAGLLLTALAPADLLGPPSARWALWGLGSEAQVTLLVLFHVASLVIMYSTALLSLDSYIERALPRTYMASVYNTRRVCGFLWGGALLTSFSSLLFSICSYLAARVAECAKMRNTEAAAAILVLIGFVVPALAALYALTLLSRVRAQATPLDQDSGRLDPSGHRLLLATVCTQLGLWTPYYLTLLGHAVLVSRGVPVGGPDGGFLRLSQDASRFLAFSSALVTPLLYRCLSKSFPGKLQRLMGRLRCRPRRCPPDQAASR